MPAWNDAQIRRFTYRQGLFMRRGMAEPVAERLADQLATRDFERDDRRCCLECSNHQRGGRCFVTRRETMPAVLQRCPSFNFQAP